MTFINFFNQIKHSINIPKCINCKYYLISNKYDKNIFANARCTKFLTANIDNKEASPEYEYAYITRNEKTMCGSDGVKFEQKK